MSVRKVCCQGCGADLEIEEGIRFVNCNYCGAKLEIVSNRTTTHSRVLEKLEKRSDEMAEDLKVIRLQNELEKLDREWAQEKQRFMVSGKDGEKSLPSTAGSMIGGVIAIVFGVFWMGTTSSMGAPGIFPLFGLVFIAFAIFGMVSGGSKASGYRNAKSRMDSKRGDLLRRLEAAKRAES
ncbi:MAG: hypothetical protein AAGI48_15615 [Verrucomicrobiota bacterium]